MNNTPETQSTELDFTERATHLRMFWSHFAGYHHHKESMAFSGVVLLLGAEAAVLFDNPLPGRATPQHCYGLDDVRSCERIRGVSTKAAGCCCANRESVSIAYPCND